MTTIYKLVDPRDSQKIPQYIGKSRNVKSRLRAHVGSPHSSRLRKWICGLKTDGTKPALIVLRVVADEVWRTAEKEEVDKARLLNPNLLNVVDGGWQDGPSHELAIMLGKHAGRLTAKFDAGRLARGRRLAIKFSRTKKGRALASTRGKNNIIKSHATMRRSYYGTLEHLQNASLAGRKGIRAAQKIIRNGYWKSTKAQADRSAAGKIRATFTNHKRWHIERNRIVESCALCSEA